MKTINLGNVGSKERAEKIFIKLNGKSYMNFIVDFARSGENWPVTISTERMGTSKKELRKMVLFVLACEL